MTLRHIGELTLGACMPLAASGVADAIAKLEAQLAGYIALQARLTITPPSLSANVQIAAKLLANAQASVEAPGISFQLAAVVALIAAIQAQLLGLLALQLGFGAAGVHLYELSGRSGTVGGELATEFNNGHVSGPDSELYGVTLVATASAPEAQLAIAATFGLTVG